MHGVAELRDRVMYQYMKGLTNLAKPDLEERPSNWQSPCKGRLGLAANMQAHNSDINWNILVYFELRCLPN